MINHLRGQGISLGQEDDHDSNLEQEQLETTNYAILRDALSGPIIQKLALPGSQTESAVVSPTMRKRRPHPRRKRDDGPPSTHQAEGGTERGTSSTLQNQAEEDDINDLIDFTDYLSTELYAALPTHLRRLNFASQQSAPDDLSTSIDIQAIVDALPPTVNDSLVTYSILPSSDHVSMFLASILESYIAAALAPPSNLPSLNGRNITKPQACELCERDWVPLTYHHLIPKSTHDKVRKRGWHPNWMLDSVAWLCRACHSFVHRIEKNEELARRWYTVERLKEREDVQVWVDWVGRIRWKKR
ncbi:MAG: hypothetical protein M1823_006206 [Watsoniomyces obsoletus]|nr:MAG: hypothetical protein M1823_006206 [Watsoniomyces obsoletus]